MWAIVRVARARNVFQKGVDGEDVDRRVNSKDGLRLNRKSVGMFKAAEDEGVAADLVPTHHIREDGRHPTLRDVVSIQFVAPCIEDRQQVVRIGHVVQLGLRWCGFRTLTKAGK